MKRREFLQLSTIGAATTMAAPWARAAEGSSARWRVFELTTQVDVLFPVGATRVWLPVPLREDTDWQKGLGDRWTSDRGDLVLATDPAYGAAFVSAAKRFSAMNRPAANKNTLNIRIEFFSVRKIGNGNHLAVALVFVTGGGAELPVGAGRLTGRPYSSTKTS